MPAETHVVLQLQSVHKSYSARGERVDALRGIDLRVRAGELVVLRGRSGSGKSTLLNVAGLLTPADSGEVVVAGRSAAQLGEQAAADLRRDAIGFVFQAFNLVPHLTALENVALPHPASAREAEALGRQGLASVGLAERAGHLPGELSGGEQQRVAVARALVNAPRLLLADEPTGNLDEESERLVLGALRAAASNGCGVLVVSHSDSVADVADRVLVIAAGQLGPQETKVQP